MEGEGPHVKMLPHHSYCTDCTGEYAMEMRAAGLCAHPEAYPHKDGDGIYMRRHDAKAIPIRLLPIAA